MKADTPILTLTADQLRRWKDEQAALEKEIAEAQQKLASVGEKLRAAAVLTTAEIGPMTVVSFKKKEHTLSAKPDMTETVERLANESPTPITKKAVKAKLMELGFEVDVYFYTIIARLKAKERITVLDDGRLWRAPGKN